MKRLRGSLSESAAAFRAVFANPGLRRIELALIGSESGKWLYLVALSVYAFDKGGATAVGVVAAIRYWPAFIGAPFISIVGDRYPRKRVMVVATLLRAAGLAAAAVIIAVDGPAVAVYVLTAFVTLLSTAFRPAQAALLPTLARTPQELTAANVASSTIASLAIIMAPAVGGLLLVATSLEAVFGVATATFLFAALLVSGIKADDAPARVDAGEKPSLLAESLGGFRAIARTRGLRVLVALYAAQTLVAGAMGVLIVVTALETLDLGDSGVGFLNAALGVGGLIGALVTLALVASPRLGSKFAIGLALWGAPLALLGLWPNTTVALVLLACIGIGDTIVDVTGFTLLQRSAPNDVLARVFGALESLHLGGFGLGALIAPLLISLLGVRGALVASGMLLPLLAILFWRQLRRIDDTAYVPVRELDLLRRNSIFGALPPDALEGLAASLAPLTAHAGDTIIREGDPGDRFYIVADGRLEVSVTGGPPKQLGPGDSFGEIALLRDVPRTATVTAVTDVDLYGLERDDFIATVTGHAPSERAADALIATRLGSFRPGVAAD